MATEEDCRVFRQKIIEIEERAAQQMDNIDKKTDGIHKDLHNHIRELRADYSDSVVEQAQRHTELTMAMTELTGNTKELVDAIKAGKFIGSVARWAVPIVAVCAAVAAYLSNTPQPPS